MEPQAKAGAFPFRIRASAVGEIPLSSSSLAMVAVLPTDGVLNDPVDPWPMSLGVR